MRSIKNLTKSLKKAIKEFTKIRSTDKGSPRNVCTNCDTFTRFYEKQKEHYLKVQEMFTFALKKHRKPEELFDLRTKFDVSDQLQDWKTLGLVDVKVKVERLDNSLFESFTVDAIDDSFQNPETELVNPVTEFVVKAEPMSPRPASPENIPFLPQYSPESDLPDKFDNSPPPSPAVEDSDSGGLSDHFEFTGRGRKVKFVNWIPNTTYECDFCGFTICWKHSMIQHMKTKHTVRETEIFNCKKCPKMYRQIGSLRMHVNRKHRTKPLPKLNCELCDKELTSKTLLKYHVDRVHENRRDHQCSICSKMFITRGIMKQHELTHTETKDFQCTICSKRWNSEAVLKLHMKRHNSVACFCDICGIKVVSAKQLKQHKETVHGGKVKHTCIACGKEFTRSKSYKEHLIAIHTDLRHYICRYCEKTFNNGSNCAKHKRESHPAEFAEEKKRFDLKGTSLPSFEELHARIKADLVIVS